RAWTRDGPSGRRRRPGCRSGGGPPRRGPARPAPPRPRWSAARWPGGDVRAAARGGTGGPGPRWWDGCHAWELLGGGGDDVRSGASAADDGAGAVVDGVQIRGVARAGRQGAHGTGEGVLDPAGEDLAAGREDGTVAAVGVESVD